MADNTEILRRRTFAIIAHPDAGKTSLTEKLLLFGGQIQVAGAVKSNKIKKTATSDWMEIEKQRGISVTTSVMEFDYRDYKINILDTPGHQDFAEDTYRTLTAVDSVIIVVDGAKGVETQTRKLMEVCRMRNTPVIIFVNKMDREGKDPFDLLDELEEELMIQVRPLSWPIEQGPRFKGVYNIYEQKLDLYQPSKQVVTEKVEIDIHSDELDRQIGDTLADKLRGDLELIEGVYPEFDIETYLQGECAPVFFGSALNNFGVQELLNCFVEIAPAPRPVHAEEREVIPEEPKFTGFISRLRLTSTPITVRAWPSAKSVQVSLYETPLICMYVMVRLCVSPHPPSLWHNVRRLLTRLGPEILSVCRITEHLRLAIRLPKENNFISVVCRASHRRCSST